MSDDNGKLDTRITENVVMRAASLQARVSAAAIWKAAGGKPVEAKINGKKVSLNQEALYEVLRDGNMVGISREYKQLNPEQQKQFLEGIAERIKQIQNNPEMIKDVEREMAKAAPNILKELQDGVEMPTRLKILEDLPPPLTPGRSRRTAPDMGALPAQHGLDGIAMLARAAAIER